MSQTLQDADGIDRLLSDFFKSKMPHPWPAPPVPPGALAEPSTLAAARDDRREREARPAASSGNRARYTLAASVALMLGACWYLSTGANPAGKPASPVAPGTGTDFLSPGSAKLPEPFEKHGNPEKKEKGKRGFHPGSIPLQ